ncbi:hypothetical protein [Wolbachia pipientis]|uniref:hypothetical protein n=1 Tax=Wolbachia pipientis TaxID=955 RepID=UPI002174DBAA|nr:hypothetical protein [Wolbachia pipientis]
MVAAVVCVAFHAGMCFWYNSSRKVARKEEKIDYLDSIALFTIIRTDRNMLLACYSHKHISYRIRTIIRKAINLKRSEI